MMYLYVVDSNSSVSRLQNLFESNGLHDVYFRVICSRKHDNFKVKETNRTLVLSHSEISKETFEEMDLVSYDYDWSKFRGCNDEVEQRHLHFRGFPRTFTEDEISKIIKETLSFVFKDETPYKLMIPVVSRNTGMSKGFGRVMFNESVDNRTRDICKLLLNNMNVSNRFSNKYISCRWLTNVVKRKPISLDLPNYTKKFEKNLEVIRIEK